MTGNATPAVIQSQGDGCAEAEFPDTNPSAIERWRTIRRARVGVWNESAMNEQLQRVLDRATIREVVERYCRGIDRLDADLVNAVYWPEATDDHGIYRGPGKDFAAFVIPFLQKHYEATMHTLGQSLIEFDDPVRARSETYFVAYHRGLRDGRQALDTAAGRYVDRFERRDGEWRIADRTVVIEWSATQADLGVAAYDVENFTQGRRDRTDIAYGGR